MNGSHRTAFLCPKCKDRARLHMRTMYRCNRQNTMTSTNSTSAYRRSVSFRQHEDHRPTRYNMAKAGFYYTSDDLVVKCCACKSIVTRFCKGADPFGATAHRSNCPFSIRETENGEAAASAAAAATSVRHSVCKNGFVS